MTLRARLLTGMAAIAVVLAVAAGFIARTTEQHLVEQVDSQLARAQAPPVDRPPPRGQYERLSSVFVAVFDGITHDFEIYAVPNLAGDDVPPVPELTFEEALVALEDAEPFTLDGYRVLVRADRVRGGNALFVYALPLDDVESAVDRLVAGEVVAVLAVLAVLTLVSFWVIRLGVRPIKQMTSTATAIAGGDLSHRVPDVAKGTEAGELGEALNVMLGRIEGSQERLKQFIADASHELRTPITTIRGYAELYRGGGLSEETELAEAMRRTEQEAIRMGGLVDDLLHLARLDQGRPIEREPVDVAALARDAVRDAHAIDPERPITVDADRALVVQGDESRLRQVLANLVTNALVHTEPGTAVHMRASRVGDDAMLEVTDRGSGMPPDVAARAFERFFRADPSRSRHRGGSGLGLAIVDATVTAHGGSAHLETAPGAGTTVRVVLPLSS